jgi:hypothetical protein
MKIHVALQNDSVKTQLEPWQGNSYRDAVQTAKEMPYQGAPWVQTAYMTGNMHPTERHLQPQIAAPFVPGSLDD